MYKDIGKFVNLGYLKWDFSSKDLVLSSLCQEYLYEYWISE